MSTPTEGRKDDSGKLRYDLMPPDALAELARVYTVGAARYGEGNWLKGISYSRIYAALERHIQAWRSGIALDQDDQLHHLAHAGWNCFTLMAYEMRGMTEFDDRPNMMEWRLP